MPLHSGVMNAFCIESESRGAMTGTGDRSLSSHVLEGAVLVVCVLRGLFCRSPSPALMKTAGAELAANPG